jgi:hypothetical protein
MPQDFNPPIELVEGPRKHILTEKAREAAEVSARHIKPWPASVKTLSATVSVPVKLASVKSSSSTTSVPIGPVSVAQVAPSCPSDYTGDKWELDNNCYFSPLPAPSSPTPLESEDDANAIDIDSEVEDMKPGAGESTEAELSTSYHITFELVLTFSSQARLSKEWVLPIYVFFAPSPRIEHVNDCHIHIFQCAALQCKGRHGRDVCRFLDTGDTRSTSGLQRHAKMCWGEETVNAVDKTKDLAAAHTILANSGLKRNGSVTAAFERIGKPSITFSHRQLTYMETR